MKVAIVQSAYIPWKGYFDIIKAVDHFVFYDDVQFIKRHWHNRNLIMTPAGPHWLTIPVVTKGRFQQPIDEVRVFGPWAGKHWNSMESNYARAPFFSRYRDWIHGLFVEAGKRDRLTEINELFTRAIATELGLRTTFSRSSEIDAGGQKTDRLLAICRALDARSYLSGPSAKDYFEGAKFDAAGIAYEWMDYSGYPQYPQRGPAFDHAVTVLDLLFNVGPEASSFMKPFPRDRQQRSPDG